MACNVTFYSWQKVNIPSWGGRGVRQSAGASQRGRRCARPRGVKAKLCKQLLRRVARALVTAVEARAVRAERVARDEQRRLAISAERVRRALGVDRHAHLRKSPELSPAVCRWRQSGQQRAHALEQLGADNGRVRAIAQLRERERHARVHDERWRLDGRIARIGVAAIVRRRTPLVRTA